MQEFYQEIEKDANDTSGNAGASIIARISAKGALTCSRLLPLVECIPNFSEARRPEVINAIRQAIQSVPSIHLLDQHSDMDHNRTVLTFVGPPGQVGEAAFRAIAKAAELIDLDKHEGEHPRIGATDVVPFVPISGVTMEECVEIARSLGERVGSKLGIPVYLYEAAAARPDALTWKISAGENTKLSKRRSAPCRSELLTMVQPGWARQAQR